jgi:hypothetical protein
MLKVTSLVVPILLLGVLAACDGPTSPSRSTPPSPTPGAATLTRVEMTGSDAVPPGETRQLTAIAHFSDGASTNVTNDSTWSSSNTNTLAFTAPGAATGRARGEVTVRASYRALQASRVMFVMPAGTFRLTGRVTEAGFPINGAQVDVVSGAGAGLSTMTVGGLYRFYGVAGDTQVQVRMGGYDLATQTIDVAENRSLDFELRANRPYPTVAGTYRVTLTAGTCPGGLPDDVKTRTYSAQVSQDGPQVTIRLQGADFVLDRDGIGNGFAGRLIGDSMTAQLSGGWDYYYYRLYPSVVERVSSTVYLSFSGTLTIPIARSELGGGTLNGGWFVSDTANGYPRISCMSQAHQFSFTRTGT